MNRDKPEPRRRVAKLGMLGCTSGPLTKGAIGDDRAGGGHGDRTTDYRQGGRDKAAIKDEVGFGSWLPYQV